MVAVPPLIGPQREARTSARLRRASTGRLRFLTGSPLGIAVLVTVGLVLLTALVAPWLWGEQAATFDTSALNQGPSPEHWLGTDNLGRDIGLRVLVATRLAVGLALAATAIGFVLGVALGSVGALAGRTVRRTTSAGINIAVAFPGLLLAIFFAIIFGVGKLGAVLALGIAAAPWFARLTQTLIASVLEREYVAAATVIGIGRATVLRRHIFPNVAEPLLDQRGDGGGCEPGRLRRLVLPRHRCPAARLRLGQAPPGGDRLDLPQPGGCAGSGSRRSWSPAWPST